MEIQNSKVTLSDFTMLSLIGKGAYAKVVLVRKKGKQNVYAMKIIKKKYIERKKQEKTAMTERNILKQAKHPFIIKLHYSFQNQKKLFFALQYCPGGDLYGLISNQKRFSQQQAKFYAAQIVLGLGYLHQKNFVYRDLKPENVLLDSKGYIRLTDFGLSRIILNDETNNMKCGTPQYFAPEILYQDVQGKPVDWWCLGCIIYEMVVGLPPFYMPDNQKELFKKIKYQNPDIPYYLSKKLVNLLEGLLQKKSQIRLGTKYGVQQIKSHPWFSGFDWQSLFKKVLKPPFPIKVQSMTDVHYFPAEYKQEAVQSPTDNEIRSDDGKLYVDFSFEKSKEETIEFQEQKKNQSMQFTLTELQ